MSREEDQTCIHCGWPTRFSVDTVYQCKGGCPTTPLPTAQTPVRVPVALESAEVWEKALDEQLGAVPEESAPAESDRED